MNDKITIRVNKTELETIIEALERYLTASQDNATEPNERFLYRLNSAYMGIAKKGGEKQ